MHTEPTPHAPPAALHTSSDCIASSRVGARIRTRTPERFLPRSFSSRGRKKASVLPEPVLATPIVSRPAMSGGQHCACSGLGLGLGLGFRLGLGLGLRLGLRS